MLIRKNYIRGMLSSAVLLVMIVSATKEAFCGDECIYPNAPGELRRCDPIYDYCPSFTIPEPLPPYTAKKKTDFTSYNEGVSYLDFLVAAAPDVIAVYPLATTPMLEPLPGNPEPYDNDFYDVILPPNYFADILTVKITEDVSSGPYEDRPDLLIVCGVHARERITAETCMTFIDFLVSESSDPVWHLFVVRHSERDLLRLNLAKQGIETLVHYPVPPCRQKAYRDVAQGASEHPLTSQIAEEVISLPIGPHLRHESVQGVIAAIQAAERQIR